MLDALVSQLLDKAPTWALILSVAGVQLWLLIKRLDKIDERLENHEDVLTDGGYADVVEKTNGGRRLVPLRAHRRVLNGDHNG